MSRIRRTTFSFFITPASVIRRSDSAIVNTGQPLTDDMMYRPRTHTFARFEGAYLCCVIFLGGWEALLWALAIWNLQRIFSGNEHDMKTSQLVATRAPMETLSHVQLSRFAHDACMMHDALQRNKVSLGCPSSRKRARSRQVFNIAFMSGRSYARDSPWVLSRNNSPCGGNSGRSKVELFPGLHRL